MSLVCFDSNFVVWGAKREATPGQEDKIDKAVLLLEQLEGQDKQIVVPSIVSGRSACLLYRLPYSRRLSP